MLNLLTRQPVLFFLRKTGKLEKIRQRAIQHELHRTLGHEWFSRGYLKRCCHQPISAFDRWLLKPEWAGVALECDRLKMQLAIDACRVIGAPLS